MTTQEIRDEAARIRAEHAHLTAEGERISTIIRNNRKELSGRDLHDYNGLIDYTVTALKRAKSALDKYNMEDARMYISMAKRFPK